jgi:purine-nucleoside phosphorylase
VALVLGSGSNQLVEALVDPVSVAFSDLTGFPEAGVEGHEGRFVRGGLDGVDVIVQAGRYHAYEGWPADVVVAPVRLMAELGVETLVMTNAVGGIREDLEPGDLVLIDDQINLTLGSPLAGPVAAGEERFPDMSAPFDPELAALARSIAVECGIRLVEGTYVGVSGPAYETAAEVRMMARFGADVVGMSTVPEILTARALGLRSLVLSLVTNRATGRSGRRISHADVLEVGEQGARDLARIVTGLLKRLAARQSAETK